MRELLEHDAELEAIFRSSPPCAFEREGDAGPFVRVVTSDRGHEGAVVNAAAVFSTDGSW
ncbi:MAG TPA: hypothetical protein VEB43_08115 [Anaeromyxobacter sp.]|nr:hypothetical protein [Anaeromyxobacter sp.]